MSGRTRPAVVAIGGGHGLAMSLRAVRTYAGRITAVVATGDDGGSSGRVRAELNQPAPGDLRRCLTTMAADAELAAAFEHRFGGSGPLAGHAVGNLVLAGLVDAGRDLDSAAEVVSGWLGIDSHVVRVLPATNEPVELVVTTAHGTVRGQVEAERARGVQRLAIEPAGPTVPAAVVEALDRADQIVLGPGSFFTSVMAAAIVPAVRDAIAASDGTVVLVANLRPDDDTLGGVGDYLSVLDEHAITPDVVVVQAGTLDVGDAGDIKVVVADVDRPHGLAHDSQLLGEVLSDLW